MIIKRKSDVERLIREFNSFGKNDGVKFYIVIKDSQHNGSITFMQYDNNVYTYYRKNESFWDIKEQKIEIKELCKVLWRYRKYVNQYLRN